MRKEWRMDPIMDLGLQQRFFHLCFCDFNSKDMDLQSTKQRTKEIQCNQDKTTQDNTRQHKTTQDKTTTRQDNCNKRQQQDNKRQDRQGKTTQHKTQDNTMQHTTIQDNRRQQKKIQDQTTQNNTRLDNTRRKNTRLDKTTHARHKTTQDKARGKRPEETEHLQCGPFRAPVRLASISVGHRGLDAKKAEMNPLYCKFKSQEEPMQQVQFGSQQYHLFGPTPSFSSLNPRHTIPFVRLPP